MAGLILKLAPKERILINGAVVENGERRTQISVKTPKANILRLKDAIHPEQANTPVKRACYLCQVILSGDMNTTLGLARLMASLEELSLVFRDDDSRLILNAATACATDGNYYGTLREVRRLLSRETRMLSVQP